MNEVGESPLTNGSPRPVSQNGPEHMNIGPRGSPPHRPLLGPSQSSQAIWPPVKGLLLGGGKAEEGALGTFLPGHLTNKETMIMLLARFVRVI